MSLALTRAEAFRPQLLRQRPAAPGRNYGDLASKVCILALFSSMAMGLAQNAAETGHVTGIMLVVSEALVVALTLVRRNAGIVDRSWRARLLTLFATFGPPLVRPTSLALAPEAVTVALSGVGLIIVVLGKLSLGRSFGLMPANRGVVSTGLYRLVRHPIYLGYLVAHLGFVFANYGPWNLCVLLAADGALLLRAINEERTLALDDQYRSYMQRVRWRILPAIF